MSFQQDGRARSPSDAVERNRPVYSDSSEDKKDGIAEVDQLEHVLSDVPRKDHMDYDRVDVEVAKYASDANIIISEEENNRLRRLIDKRVLVIMIFTYFIQALGR